MRAAAPFVVTAALTASAALAAPHASSPALLSASPPPPLLSAMPSASAAPAAPAPGSETCHEHLPEGKTRPKLTETVPSKGQSGHALTLQLVLEHGKGETVLPGGFQTQTDDPNVRALERAGLYLPDPDGGAGPVLVRTEEGDRATTKLDILVRAAAAEAGAQHDPHPLAAAQHRARER